jgi:translation initiation factor IF-2
LAEEATLASLQRGENAVNEVYEGEECGIKYTGNVKLQEGDVLEAYKMEKTHRSLGEVKKEKPTNDVKKD